MHRYRHFRCTSLAKSLLLSLQFALGWPKIAPRLAQDCPESPKTASKGPNMAQAVGITGPRRSPRRTMKAPRWLRLPKRTRGGAKMAPGWPQDGPREPQDGPREPQDGPHKPQDGLNIAQEGAKMTPRRLNIEQNSRNSSERRHNAKTFKNLMKINVFGLPRAHSRTQDEAKMAQDDPKTGQDSPKNGQDGIKIAQDCPKMSPSGSKMAKQPPR